MPLAFQISIVNDKASGAVASLRAGLQPAQLNPIVGRAARNVYREHLFGLNRQRANRLGGPRTNFYAGAARATQFRVVGDGVIVSINQVGIGLRYFGGTIKPVTAKYLTIPARAEAHGKRASEFPDLEILFGRNGPYALARRVSTLISLRRNRGTSAITVGNRGVRGGEVLFWLVKSVTQQPDPAVLPYPELVAARAVAAVDDYAQRLWDRKNPPATGGPDAN